MDAKPSNDEICAVAAILKPHGVKGEMRVRPIGDSEEHLRQCLDGREVYVAREFPATLAPGPSLARIETIRPHGDCLLVKFAGIDSPEAAAHLNGSLIGIRLGDLPPAEEGSYYHFQLEGLEVVDAEGRALGRVTEVRESPAHDQLVVAFTAPPPELLLIPLAEPFIQRIDLEAGRIEVSLPGGFVEAQR